MEFTQNTYNPVLEEPKSPKSFKAFFTCVLHRPAGVVLLLLHAKLSFTKIFHAFLSMQKMRPEFVRDGIFRILSTSVYLIPRSADDIIFRSFVTHFEVQ